MDIVAIGRCPIVALGMLALELFQARRDTALVIGIPTYGL
jgi:hypothetical protein